MRDARWLSRLYARINREYFGGSLHYTVRWGRRLLACDDGSVALGECDAETGTITICSLLTDPRIPSWYVGHVVHHECCHAVCGYPHGPRFVEAESGYKWIKRVREYEREVLPQFY